MKKYSILSFLILCVFTVSAQQTLSLSDAIQIGLQQNYGILIEKQNVDIAENNNNWGEAGRWPTISLNVNQNNGATDNVKTAFPTSTQGQTISNSIAPSINVNWTIFDGFRINISKRRLETLQAETEGNASIVIANTLQSIILGYYLAVLEQERLEVFERQLALSRDKYNYVKLQSDFGSAVTTELLLEEGNYLTDSINYLNQSLTYRNAIRDFNVVLSENDVAKSYSFTDSLQVPTKIFSIDDLRNKMFSENVDLKKQYITQSLLGFSTQLSEADRYPSLNFSGAFSENQNSLDLSNASFFNGSGFSTGPDTRLKSTTDNYSANFTLSFTLFNGGKIKRAIRNAIANEAVGEMRIDQFKTSLDRDLYSSLDQYNNRKLLFDINERRESVARLNLTLSQDKFKNGSINSFDYRDVQNNYLSSSILKLQAAYNLISSKVELMRLTGGLVKEYNQ